MTADEPTIAQQNIDLVHGMVVPLNSHDVIAQDTHWTPDMIWRGPPGFGDVHGIETFKNEVVRKLYFAFPEFHGTIDIELADDNWVAATGTVTETHQGDWFNIRPTGKQMEMRYSDFWRIESGRLAENWVMIDHVALLRQFGVDPLEIKF